MKNGFDDKGLYGCFKDEKKMGYIRLFGGYSLLFLFMYCLCWGNSYAMANRTTIWSVDGLSHDYSALVYAQKYIRHVLRNFFVDHTYVLPTWDYSIGYGSGIFVTLSTWDLVNPVKLLIVAITPYKYLEFVHQVITIIRFYCTGLAFLALAKYKNKSNAAAVAGALIYTFSITTSEGLAHSGFIVTFIIFPLLLIAVDDLWEKKYSILYVVILTLALINSFYFFYMMCLGVFAYCMHKFFICGVGGRRSLSLFITNVMKFIFHSMIVLGIGAFAYLPASLNLSSTDRLEINRAIPMFYEKSYYRSFLQGFIDAYDSANDWMLGFSAISLVFALLLFTSSIKKHFFIKISFIEMTIGMLIPFVGHMMNGFSYSSNRWIFMYLLCVAYVVTAVIDELNEYTDKNVIVIMGMIIIYGALIVLVFHNTSKRQLYAVGFALLSSMVIYFLLKNPTEVTRIFYKQILILVCIASLWISAGCHYNPDHNYFINSSVVRGDANNLLDMSDAQEILMNLDKAEASRYDFSNVFYIRNASWARGNGHSCMDMYMNLYNNNIDIMNKHLAIHTEPFNFSYRGVGQRAELDAIYGVKYFLSKVGDEDSIPEIYDTYYKNEESFGTNYVVNVASKDIGMAYLFDKQIDYASYCSLSPFERQQVLLQAVVRDEGNSNLSELKMNHDDVAFEMAEESPIKGSFRDISVNEEAKQIVLDLNDIQEKGDGEWYIYFEDYLKLDDSNNEYGTQVQLYNREFQIVGDIVFSSLTEKSHMYGQKHDWLLKLGNYGECSRIVITFNTMGHYSIENLKVYHRLKSEIIDSVNNLQNAGDLKLYDNRMEITTNAASDKILFISVPYSNGWSAFVDGKKTQILLTDDAFMSIDLPAGEHKVVFRYHTPGMLIAIILSIGSLMLYVCLYGRYRKKGKCYSETTN